MRSDVSFGFQIHDRMMSYNLFMPRLYNYRNRGSAFPWAAYVQDRDGYYFTLEQQELIQTLEQQSADNPDEIDLESAIATMAGSAEIIIEE